ncbi:tRNA 2-selenouridine(34) synthase MnmH [Sansalvadorimonas sp. 2012CJ34-2]|uniref:tRNA 2-selenouridine synthase n=1 Tax=Parendozoicomonas callyspongiae TaxID=2942213 RepID=A0ABT0PK40_9GAMM|nr:tRNA 2-selenouridine(34) synthase MnmH [Sansalvadorimonas sp. 2012CJ34-2]MCL6271641.1 tRNA 2-selenouridine(34) synthase MnmH [Sansalvadorimonas sp. 2012CJ34-2]
MTDSRPNTSDYEQLFLNDTPLLDVRAPVEFEKGSFPQSQNQPLMNNEERQKIGTCYKRSGHDAAMALGHSLVNGKIKADRMAAWIQFTKENPDGYLYCFRGGERSHLVQSWLKEAGIHYPLVTGGYKAVRSFLIEQLEESIEECNFVILGGKTGTGKTRLLEHLPSYIDLEGLANHRGSSFGRRIGGQPSQIDFENRLAIEFIKSRNAGRTTIVLEDESKLIGRCCLPLSLKEKMQKAPIILLEEDLETRVQITFEEYIEQNLFDNICAHGKDTGFATFADDLLASLDRIRKRLGGARHQELRTIMEEALLEQRDHNRSQKHRDWIRTLLRDYYDPMYEFQLEQKSGRITDCGNCRQLQQKYSNANLNKLFSE